MIIIHPRKGSPVTAPPLSDARPTTWTRCSTEQLHLAVTPLQPGTKIPLALGWNPSAGYMRGAAEVQQYGSAHPTHGMGVVLAPSQLVALVVDAVQGAGLALDAAVLDLASTSRLSAWTCSRCETGGFAALRTELRGLWLEGAPRLPTAVAACAWAPRS
jgi:Bifunctional DNA primase/polymerase, N-terminal